MAGHQAIGAVRPAVCDPSGQCASDDEPGLSYRLEDWSSIPGSARFSLRCNGQTQPPVLSSAFVLPEFIPSGVKGPGRELTTDLYLVPTLRKCGVVQPLPLTSV